MTPKGERTRAAAEEESVPKKLILLPLAAAVKLFALCHVPLHIVLRHPP